MGKSKADSASAASSSESANAVADRMHTFSHRSATDGGALAKYNVNSTFPGSVFTVSVAHSTTSGSFSREYISVLVVISFRKGIQPNTIFRRDAEETGPRAACCPEQFRVFRFTRCHEVAVGRHNIYGK